MEILGISIWSIVGVLAFLVIAPILGCILAGLDRKVTAGMQGRVGPKLLQPWWDFRKLLAKEDVTVNGAQDLYIWLYLIFILLSGAIFFAGGNFLLCIFVQTLGSLFFILAGYASRSPYADLGAERETVQVMSYEPMVLLVAIGMFMATGSFTVADLLGSDVPLVRYTPLIFLGFVYVLTIKFRKSPFDISMSHHAHQEIVRGIVTELSGRTLAIVELSHWYETILFLGWTCMFVVWAGGWVAAVVAIAVAAIVWFLEIWIDNNFARVKWETMLKSAWWVALIAGTINVVYLIFV